MEKRKRKNGIAVLTICIAMLVCATTCGFASSNDAPSINDFQVQDRLTKLIKNYNGTYFTTTNGVYGKKDPHGALYHRTWFCSHCTVDNVIKTAKVRNEYRSGITVNNMPKHHNFDWRVWFGGDSCCGFATFAGFYTFANGLNRNVIGEPVYRYYYDSGSAQYMRKFLKAGDMIRFDSSHSAIYLGDVNSSGMLVIDSNYWYTQNGVTKGVCQVRTHRIPFSRYSKIGVTRGGNAVNVPRRKATVAKVGGTARLSWKKVKGADYYIIYRSTKARSGFRKIDETRALSYRDAGARGKKRYYYKIRSVNRFRGEKKYSDCGASATWA